MAVSNLFVYGTLLRAARHPMHRVLQRDAAFIGGALFDGRLIDLGSYPGAVPSEGAGDTVKGEVYTLVEERRDAALAALDTHEGCNDVGEAARFERKAVEVRLLDGRPVRAWIYLYVGEARGRPTIADGDYARDRGLE